MDLAGQFFLTPRDEPGDDRPEEDEAGRPRFGQQPEDAFGTTSP
jgi:hypothetical protein